VVAIFALSGNQFTLINNLLAILLYLLVPWTAVNLTDYFFVRKGHYAIAEIFDRNGIYGLWSRRGLTAYFVALACEVPFMVLSFYKGIVPQHIDGIDISFAIGLVVASVLYYLLARDLPREVEEAAIAESDAELENGINPEDPDFRASHGMV
jgi:nucleobase:cation symporter-1, NCS1 family